MLQTYRLNNGLQVATYRLPSLKSVYLQLTSRGGSLVETKDNNGVAHFMEHLLVQGIPSYPNVEEFSQFIERLAGSYGAFTDSMSVGFNITVPSIHLEEALKIGSEVFFEPLFVEQALEKERRVIIEEIRQRMDDSHWYKINQFFRTTRFGEDHPLTLSPGGSIEVVKSTNRQDLWDYWQKYFVPNNCFLMVTGNFAPDKTKALIKDYFGRYSRGKNFVGFPKMSKRDFSKRQVAIRYDHSVNSNYVDLAFPSVSLDDPLPLRIKENIALIILGGLRNSRLFKLLRYDRGLVYHVSAGASVWPGLGYVYISSEVTNKSLEEVVELIAREVANFIQAGPSEEELEFVKNYLSNQWLMAFDHPSAIASWIENDLLSNDKVRLPEEYIDLVKDITVEDIQQLMQKYWDLSRLNLTIQGPLRPTPRNLAKFEALISDLK